MLEALIKTDQTLLEKQALAKQLGLTLDFVLRFDDCKMKTIAIQNDFSHFRRTSNGAKMKGIDIQIDLKDDLANRMSLFYASPTPMMTALVNSFSDFMKVKRFFKFFFFFLSISFFLQKQNKIDVQTVTPTIATISNVCQEMVRSGKFEKSSTNLFCLRTMTGCILMYDNLDKGGAFSKKSAIHVRKKKGHFSKIILFSLYKNRLKIV